MLRTHTIVDGISDTEEVLLSSSPSASLLPKSPISYNSPPLLDCRKLMLCAGFGVLVFLPVCWTFISGDSLHSRWNRSVIQAPALFQACAWSTKTSSSTSLTTCSVSASNSFSSSWLWVPPTAGKTEILSSRELLSVHWTDLNSDLCPDLLVVSTGDTSGCSSSSLRITSLISSCPGTSTPNTVSFVSDEIVCNTCLETSPAVSTSELSLLSVDIDGDFDMDLVLALSLKTEKPLNTSVNPEDSLCLVRLSQSQQSRCREAPSVWQLLLTAESRSSVSAPLSANLMSGQVREPLLMMDWNEDGMVDVLHAFLGNDTAAGNEKSYRSLSTLLESDDRVNNSTNFTTPRCLPSVVPADVLRTPFACNLILLALMEADFQPSILCFGRWFPREMLFRRYQRSTAVLENISERYLIREINSTNASLSISGEPYVELRGACVADLNGDSIADYVVAATQGLFMWLSAGYRDLDQHLVYSRHQLLSDHAIVPHVTQGALAVACHDMDNDGDVDAIALFEQGIVKPRTALFLNDGKGHLSYSVSLSPSITLSARLTALAVADYDNDGRLDVLLAHSAGFLIYRNLLTSKNTGDAHWLEVVLWGLHTCTSFGTGGIVKITAGGGALSSYRVVHAPSDGFSPYAQTHQRLHFGLGGYSVVDEVLVVWPCAAQTQRYESVQADQIIQILQLNNFVPTLPINLMNIMGTGYHFNASLGLCARTGEKRLSPSFFIIGQFKCGTTSMASSLTAHPQIKGPSQKELNYWDVRAFELGLDWYAQNFPCGTDEQITFEASPEYFGHDYVPPMMMKAFPKAKLVLLLRDPVTRAFSHYRMWLRAGMQGSFLSLVREELENLRRCVEDFIRYSEPQPLSNAQLTNSTLVPFPALSKCVAHGQGFVTGGMYSIMLQRWWLTLGPESRGQMLIIISEEFDKRPHEVITVVHRFLGVRAFENTFRRENVASDSENEVDAEALDLLRAFFSHSINS